MTRKEDSGSPLDGEKAAQKRELDLLEGRIAAARKARGEEPKGETRVLLGAGIGWFVDWLAGTLPIFLVIFTGLGTVAGVKNVLRATQAMNATAAKTTIESSGHMPGDATAGQKSGDKN